MKKLFTCIILLAALFNCKAQQSVILNIQNKVSGSVTIPALQNLNVTTQTSSLNFSDPGDFSNGKEIAAFYLLNVNSNVPWVITAKTETDNFNNLSANGNNLPAGIVSIKNSTDNNYVALSQTVNNFIISSNDKIVNDYKVDLKINPSWKYGGGLYNINIIFTLTPQ